MIKVYYRKADKSLGMFESDWEDERVQEVRMIAIEMLQQTEPKPVAVLALLQGGVHVGK